MGPEGLLLFPPVWAPYSPPLGVAVLARWMQQQGFSVEAYDLNLEFFRSTLAPAKVLEALSILKERFSHLELRDNLSRDEALQYVLLSHPAAMDSAWLAREIEMSTDILSGKTDGFFDPEQYEGAKQSLIRALSVFSSAYGNVLIGLSQVVPGPEAFTEDAMRALAIDGVGNPFSCFSDSVISSLPIATRRLVGISVIDGSQLLSALTLGANIRRRFPQVHVTFGGSYFSLNYPLPSEALRVIAQAGDSVCVGEGEYPLLELLRYLRHGTEVRANSVVSLTSGRAWSVSSDPKTVYPFCGPDYGNFRLTSYVSPGLVWPIQATRGCHYGKCAFCSHGAVYQGSYRSLPSEVLRSHVVHALRSGASSFFFVDESLSIDMLNCVSAVMESVGSPSWSCNLRASGHLDLRLAKQLRRSGMSVAFIGLESGSDRVLRLMRKGTTVAQVESSFRSLAESGIWTHAFAFIGFPGETKDDALRTCQLLIENRAYIDSVGLGKWICAKQSPIAVSPEKYGISIQPPHLDPFSVFHRYEGSPSSEEAGQILASIKQELRSHFDEFANEVLDDPHRQLYVSRFGHRRWSAATRSPNEGPSPDSGVGRPWISTRTFRYPVFSILGCVAEGRPLPPVLEPRVETVAFDRQHDTVIELGDDGTPLVNNPVSRTGRFWAKLQNTSR